MSVKILFLPLLSLIMLCALLGCGGDENVVAGEGEVVVEKWKEPTDIGKVYTVGEVKVGDTVTFSDGETYKVRKWDTIKTLEDGTTILSTVVGRQDANDPNFFWTDRVEKTIVPEGTPIVAMFDDFWDDTLEELIEERQITADNNVRKSVMRIPRIRIDRVLDYNLPIYVEHQLQTREALGGEVTRIRFLLVVPKGETRAVGRQDFSPAEPEEHVRMSVSILPYTDMKEIPLPAKIGANPESHEGLELPLEDKIIPEGHTFRPYRIESSSFYMGIQEFESNW